MCFDVDERVRTHGSTDYNQTFLQAISHLRDGYYMQREGSDYRYKKGGNGKLFYLDNDAPANFSAAEVQSDTWKVAKVGSDFSYHKDSSREDTQRLFARAAAELSRLFNWEASPEGHAYWSDAYNRLMKLAQDN